MRMTLKYLCCMGGMCVMLVASAQAQTMTMTEAIQCARSGSVQALEARQEFISVYWAFRAYQASRLPSLYLYGNLGNFNRPLSLHQSPDDGSMLTGTPGNTTEVLRENHLIYFYNSLFLQSVHVNA